MFVYGRSNPIGYRDPFGLDPCKDKDGNEVPCEEEQQAADDVQPCTEGVWSYLTTPGISDGRQLVWESGLMSTMNPANRSLSKQPWEYSIWANVAQAFLETLRTSESSLRVGAAPRPAAATSLIHNHGHAQGAQRPSTTGALWGFGGVGDVEAATRSNTLDVVQGRDSAFLIVPGRGVYGCRMNPWQK
jgi:hypothetical protein